MIGLAPPLHAMTQTPAVTLLVRSSSRRICCYRRNQMTFPLDDGAHAASLLKSGFANDAADSSSGASKHKDQLLAMEILKESGA